jgi:hypothetical protein
MTVRKYNLNKIPEDHILATEKQEILARLARVKAETDPSAAHAALIVRPQRRHLVPAGESPAPR